MQTKSLKKHIKKSENHINGLPEITSSFVYQNYIELPTSLVPAEFFGGKSGNLQKLILELNKLLMLQSN